MNISEIEALMDSGGSVNIAPNGDVTLSNRKRPTIDEAKAAQAQTPLKATWLVKTVPTNPHPQITRNNSTMDEAHIMQIGKYTLTQPCVASPDKIAIYHESGEGGDFDKSKLEETIAAFYKEHF